MQKRTKNILSASISALLLGCINSAFALDNNNSLDKKDPSYKNESVNAVLSPNSTKLDAKETYNKVLDIYDDYFKSTIRFKEDGSEAKLTGLEWFDDIETVGVNRERAKTQFIPYDTPKKAFLAERSSLDNIDANSSKFYKKLTDSKWDFAIVYTPEEAHQKDKEWLSKDYKGDEFQKEIVPASIQTYRNPDGTFKYDEPMYTNHGFPWQDNIQKEDYTKPKAPTVKNPVAYYRTNFTLDKDWQNREIFISLQSIESAYYIFINGKAVGYSTDSYTAHDFNITPYLNEGENTIAIKVFRWSIGSWLENQDFIRQNGIYRDIYLYSKGDAEIRDFFVKTDFVNKKDLVNSDVNLYVDTTIRGLRNIEDKTYTLTSRLLDKNGKEIALAKNTEFNIAKTSFDSSQKLLDKGTTKTISMYVKNPKKWFADTPNLYYIELVLKDDKGNTIESVVKRIGFRDLRKVVTNIKNDNNQYLEQLQINGKQLVLRGVNRHDTDIYKGRAVGLKEYLTDLSTMKHFNLNAIRTSHYPNDAMMYDLADELGLYICMDANIESHRAAFTGARVPTGPIETGEYKEWVYPVLDRNANMIEHYKNNPSVLIWSSNNEAQYEKVQYNSHSPFWVASMYALKRDPSRFRKSERASAYHDQVQKGDPWSLQSRIENIVDLHSTQYALPDSVNAYDNVQPYVHSEYNHAMGQAYGNAKEHLDVIRNKDNVNGGFIWDFIDQSILTVDKDNHQDYFLGYGGDWIDKKYNDNAFCANGLVYADHTPSPKLFEAKKVHQQVNFYLQNETIKSDDVLKIKMVNEYENTALSNFDISFSIYKNGNMNKPIAHGIINSSLDSYKGQSLNNNYHLVLLDLNKLVPSFTPKSNEDYFLDFSVRLKEDTNFGSHKGYEIAHEQFKLNFDNATLDKDVNTNNVANFTSITNDGNNVVLKGLTDTKQEFEITLNKNMGTIDSYKLDGIEVIKQGPTQSIYRAQTYNDTSAYWSEESKNAGEYSNLKNVTVNIDTSAKNKINMTMVAGLKVDAKLNINYEIYGNGEIIVLDNLVPESNFAKVGGLAKVGSRLILNNEFDNFAYYGRGPFDTYVDRKTGARIGKYQNKVIDSFDFMMLKPQENGNHTDVRYASLTNENGLGLLISTDRTLEVSALPYTAEELNDKPFDNAKYRHPKNVPLQTDKVVLNVDYKQRGVSDTAFMDHVPLDGYTVPTNRAYSYSYRITPINQNSNIEELAFRPYTVNYKSEEIIQELKDIVDKDTTKTISFNSDNDGNLDSISITKGEKISEKSLPIPIKEGYKFDGWWNYNFTQAFDFNQAIVQDVTLYAKWTKEEPVKVEEEINILDENVNDVIESTKDEIQDNKQKKLQIEDAVNEIEKEDKPQESQHKLILKLKELKHLFTGE